MAMPEQPRSARCRRTTTRPILRRSLPAQLTQGQLTGGLPPDRRGIRSARRNVCGRPGRSSVGTGRTGPGLRHNLPDSYGPSFCRGQSACHDRHHGDTHRTGRGGRFASGPDGSRPLPGRTRSSVAAPSGTGAGVGPTCLVARAEDGIHGYVLGFVTPDGTSYVHLIATRDDVRGTGLGRRLCASRPGRPGSACRR